MHEEKSYLTNYSAPNKEFFSTIKNNLMPFTKLMTYYRCAMMELETKFNVLNAQFSMQYDRNPIETIKTRLKSVESIIEKLERKSLPLTFESIEKNLNDMIKNHIENDADITIAVKKVKLSKEQAKMNVLFDSDENGRIVDVQAYPTNFAGEADINLNIMVMSRHYLQEIVLDAIAHNYTSLTKDIMLKNVSRKNYRTYKYDGYFACISSSEDYYKSNMELIKDKTIRKQLFGVKNRPIYTKVRNSAPTYYSPDAKVKNSLIADGCEIYGEVENSIIFRGTKVGKGSIVKNCILFQDTFTGENVKLNCVIADKNVVIRDNKNLSGDETLPFYLAKGKMI